MRYVAAYMLAVLGGKQSPTADDIKKILGSVGIEANDAKMKKLIADLSGKTIDALIAEGIIIIFDKISISILMFLWWFYLYHLSDDIVHDFNFFTDIIQI